MYGKYGSGKTSLAGSSADVPAMQDVLMIDAESGDLSINDSPIIQNKDRIDVVRATTFKQVARVQEFLKSHCKLRDEGNLDKLREQEAWLRGCDPTEIQTPRQYRTVIIDSLSEVEQYCLYALMGIDSTKIPDDGDTDVARFEEFRKNNQMVQLLVRAFRDLPMNVIMVCSTQYTQDEVKRMHYTPALTGKLSSQVQGFVDVVGFLTVEKGTDGAKPMEVRRLFVQPIDKFDAKNRFASYKLSHFDNPTMSSIMKAVGLLK